MVPMTAYVIVPARGGSKGIPHKNLIPVGGVPLVARAVHASMAAALVDEVFVSTDDRDIARVAAGAGAAVIDRPRELSDDTASSEAALLHALDDLEATGRAVPDLTVMVQCTSPLTTGHEIDGTIALIEREEADCAFTGTRSHAFLWQRTADGAVGVNHDPRVRPRRQDQVPEYADTGAVYAMRTDGFRACGHRFFGRVGIFEVPKAHELEIDTLDDVAIAEALLHATVVARRTAAIPRPVAGIAFDFDGVLTDDRVLTATDGTEAVISSRADGLGIEMLRRAGVPMIVLSKERNPVVDARCRKLGLQLVQGLDEKKSSFAKWIDDEGLAVERVVYLGNDVNDLDCIRHAGCGVAVADAHPAVVEAAAVVLDRRGGRGAVRELAELVCGQRHGAST